MAVYRSTHPDVLAAWAEVDKQYEVYHEACRKLPEQGFTDVYEHTGWGDSRPFAVAWSGKEPPEGWKWGDQSKSRSFIEPRAKGPGSRAAQELINNLKVLSPQPHALFKERFGVPPYIFVGLSCRTPGMSMLQGALFIDFGEDREGVRVSDSIKDWEPAPYFELVKRSAFQLALEAEEEADSTDVQSAE